MQLSLPMCIALFIPTLSHAETSVGAPLFSSESLSNQSITSMVEDHRGYLWIGTRRGLNRYNGYNYIHFFEEKDNPEALCGDNIAAMCIDKENVLWVATYKGVNRLSDDRSGFETIPTDQSLWPQQILCSNSGEIYLNLSDGVYKYNVSTNAFDLLLRFDESSYMNRFYIDANDCFWLIEQKQVRCYAADGKELLLHKEIHDIGVFFSSLSSDGMLWTCYGYGNIFLFDTKLRTKVPSPSSIAQHPVLKNAILTATSCIDDSLFLICTHKNGNFLYDSAQNSVSSLEDRRFAEELEHANISTVLLDSKKNLWIGTMSQGVIGFPISAERFSSNPMLRQYSHDKSVETVHFDAQRNRIWFSTLTFELIMCDLNSNEVQITNLRTFFDEDPFFQDAVIGIETEGDDVYLLTMSKLVICRYEKSKLVKQHLRNFYRILSGFAKDEHGRIWIDTPNSDVILFDLAKKTDASVAVFPANEHLQMGAIAALADGNIMVVAKNQAPRLISAETKEVQVLNGNSELFHQNFVPSCIYEDHAHNIWIGNYDGDVIRINSEDKEPQVIEVDNVVSAIEDKNGMLWMGTLYGLAQYDFSRNKTTHFYDFHGLPGNQFNKKAVMLPDGALVFSSTNGITSFCPKEITSSVSIPLYIENIQLNDEPLLDSDKFIASSKIDKTGFAELEHWQNNINIHYAAIDYSNYSRVKYWYQLEGYDKDWIDAGNNLSAHYSNLPPCRYTFRVKITDLDKTEAISEASLKLHIPSAPWFKWYAKLFYLACAIFLMWLLVYLRYRLKMSNEYAQIAIRESEHEAHINAMNMSFFANISHEFRTTLTTIIGPISSLLDEKEAFPASKQNLLTTIHNCAIRLNKLVGQVLDLSELESDTLPLHVEKIDIINQINTFVNMYEAVATSKEIRLNRVGLEGSYAVYVDADKLDKVLSNLLSNALKFTPAKGEIKIIFDVVPASELPQDFNLKPDEQAHYVLVKISDTGIGIPADKLENVFERFYKINDNAEGNYSTGSGIGLYYSQKLIALHHGAIKASNNDSGGAVFSLVLPTSADAYEAKEIAESAHHATYVEPLKELQESANGDKSSSTKPTILLVDDDVEISHYLRSLLEMEYTIINKYDGKSALESLAEVNPDLIISDVMMPKMNGYEFCRNIKENIAYSHIPVILLTAKVMIKEQIEGLEVGANAYVPKPFDPKYLQALIKSLLKNQQTLSSILTTQTNLQSVSEEVLAPKDKIFLDQIFTLLDEELDNPEVNVNLIAEKMKMGRTNFYQKIRGLTGDSPNKLIKKYKLNKAAELIVSGKYNISEAAFATGFANLSHFSKVFKEQFGCSPSEYEG